MLECARSRRRKNVVLASALALVGVTPAFAGNDDPRAAMIDLEIETPDGYAFSLSLDTTQFADEDFDGSFSFVGEIIGPDIEGVIPVTIEANADHVAQTLARWNDVHADGAVLSVSDAQAATLTVYDNVPGARASAEVDSFSSQVVGRITTGNAVAAAEPIFRTANSTLTSESVAANTWTFAASVITRVFVTEDEDIVTLEECFDQAETACSKTCPNGAGRDCIDSVTWSAQPNSCSFSCQSVDECCGD